MKKFKIYVYTICKNEEKFVDRWVKSMKEADGIYVLDTGSTDNTVEKLLKNGAIVKKKTITPWRFDIARNESLKMIPNDADILVCTDLDEVFISGWRDELESIWKDNTTRASYVYNWSLDKNNKPLITFYQEKIHSPKNFKWIHPVHEILQTTNEEHYVKSDKIILNHYPDNSKSRSSYLPLLELSIKENPNNDRNLHYLGREYMYHKMYNDAIDTLIKHVYLKEATWKDEKSTSMRFIGRCYSFLNRYDEAILWYKKAINEAPYLRDPYIELALLYFDKKDYINTIKYCNKALKIKTHEKTYINEIFSWNETVYDLLSVAYYNIGEYKKALKNRNVALKINSNDERLLNNNIIFKKAVKENT